MDGSGDEAEMLVGGSPGPLRGGRSGGGGLLWVAFAVAAACGASLFWPSAHDREVAVLAAASLSFSVSNEYPAPKSLFRYPWARLAEPHKETTLTAAFIDDIH